MNVMIRAATQADYEGVCALFDQLDRFHAQALPHFFRTVESLGRSREWFVGVLADRQAAFFVAEQEETLIGLVNCYVRTTSPVPVIVPRRFVYIENMGVSEHVRHQGVGQLLMERVQEWAREQEATEIELDVWDFPASALAFYEKLGYETTRRHMRKQLS